MFVPFRLPQYSDEEIAVLGNRSFGENIAAILNLFFSARLSGWDVDCCIGRHPVKLRMLGHRIVIAEIWYNLESRYRYIEDSMYHRIASVKDSAPTPWFRIALRIALLFGIFGHLLASGKTEADIALPSGDFSFVMATWYARKMGLPVGRIICACNENDNVWDLIHRGELNTGAAAVGKQLHGSDAVYPIYLEQLIFDLFGADECKRYLEKCRAHSNYQIPEESAKTICDTISAAVVWKSRVDAIMASFYRTNAYILDPHTALSFGAVQDFRAGTGENNTTLIFSEIDPLCLTDRIAPVLGTSAADLQNMLNTDKE